MYTVVYAYIIRDFKNTNYEYHGTMVISERSLTKCLEVFTTNVSIRALERTNYGYLASVRTVSVNRETE